MRQVLGFVGIVAVVMLSLGLLDVTTGSHNLQGDDWGAVLVPIGLFAFGIVLPKFGRSMSRGEERFLLEFLQDTLAARIEDSASEIQLQSSR